MDLMEAVRDPATIRQAPQIAETLERAARQRHSARLVIEGYDAIPVPAGIMHVLASISRLIQHGDGSNLATLLTSLIDDEEMTTQEVADFLGVSRPYVISLTDSGQLPVRRVGNRRKIKMRDVLGLQHQEQQRMAKIMQRFRDAEALPIPENLTPPSRFDAVRHEDESDDEAQSRQALFKYLLNTGPKPP